MGYIVATLISLLVGCICAFLLVRAHKSQDMAQGLGVILLSFVVLSICMLVVRLLARPYIIPFGVGASCSFLGASLIGVLLTKKS